MGIAASLSLLAISPAMLEKGYRHLFLFLAPPVKMLQEVEGWANT